MMWELISMSHDGMFEISGLGEGKLLLAVFKHWKKNVGSTLCVTAVVRTMSLQGQSRFCKWRNCLVIEVG